MFEKLEKWLENVLEAFKSLIGKATAVEANTAQLHQLLQEVKTRYEDSLEAKKELREAMARYFGLLLGPDAFAVMAGKRRTTKKTEVVEMVIDGGWVWHEWAEGKWDWCLPVATILLGEDWKTPIADVRPEWQEANCRLRVDLVPPVWEKLGLTEHQVIWVPLGTLLKGCDYLGFEKLVLLAPVTPITLGLFEHKSCDVCEDMVLIGPIKEADRKFYYLTLSLMGIRAFEQFKNLLANVQHNPRWGEETFQDDKGNTVTWSFLWWLVDQIIKVGATSYDAEVVLPDGVVVPAGTDPAGARVLANDWFLWLKGQIVARLWKYADEIYVRNNLQVAMDNRPPSLDHKTITDAKVRDGLWRYRTPEERWSLEALWRERVDQLILDGLRVQRRRGDLDLRDIHVAFGKDMLFRWLPETERIEQENQLLEWFHEKVQTPRARRLAATGILSWSYSDAGRLVAFGYGEWAGSSRADLECDRWFDLAWRCSRSSFLKMVARMLVLGYADPDLSSKLAEKALDAYFGGDISLRELAIFADDSPFGKVIDGLLKAMVRRLGLPEDDYKVDADQVEIDEHLAEHDPEVNYILGGNYHG